MVISTALSFFCFKDEYSYNHGLLTQETKPPLFLNSSTQIRQKQATVHDRFPITSSMQTLFSNYEGKRYFNEDKARSSSLGKVFFLFVEKRFQNRVKM